MEFRVENNVIAGERYPLWLNLAEPGTHMNQACFHLGSSIDGEHKKKQRIYYIWCTVSLPSPKENRLHLKVSSCSQHCESHK